MAAIAAERNLLFGILALQNGLIDQADLIAAFQAWSKDRSRPLSEVLLDRGALNESDRLCSTAWSPASPEARRRPRAEPGGRPDRGRGVARDSGSSPTPTSTRAGPTRGRRRRSTEPRRLDPEATTTWGIGVGPAPADGRFRVLRPHAKGGLGMVSVALDRELHREVALKEIQPERADDPQSRDRFVLEAEITGRLEHPGDRPGLQPGLRRPAGPSTPCGSSAATASRRRSTGSMRPRAPGSRPGPRERRLEFRRLLGRFLDVCNTVAYAHSRGVIHRDLKPANILLGPYGETLVVDWGLAKVVGRDEHRRPVPRRGPSAQLGLRQQRDRGRHGHRHAGLHEPGAGRGPARTDRPGQRRLQPGRDALLPPDRQAAARRGRRRRAAASSAARGVPAGRGRSRAGVPPALEAVCLKAMATQARGPLRLGAALADGDRALAGGRAGLGLSRLAGHAADPLGAAAPDARRRRSARCWSPRWLP